MRLGLSGQTFAIWFGGIWLICGLPFLMVGLYLGVTSRADTERLRLEGVLTDGVVLTKAIDTGPSRANGSRSNPVYRVRFRFTTARGEEVTGRSEISETAWRALVERGPIHVRYVPSAPTLYRVDGEGDPWFLAYIFAGVGLLMSTVGGAVFGYGIRHARAVARLVDTGVQVEATVTDIVPARITINGEPQWRIAYRYEDLSGRTYTGRSEPLRPAEVADWASGQRGRIRYDARVPRKSAWLGRAS